MNPETRRLVQVLPEAENKTKEVFDVLLGDNIKGRKEFIELNGNKYIQKLDLY